MARSMARWPEEPNNGDGSLPPSDLYRMAVEEYRFQVQHNWSRTQYFLAFNAGILSAASAVSSRPGRGAIFIFALGAVASVLSALAVHTQHDYYRAARNRMSRVEESLGVPADHRFDTTATLGKRPRRASVNQVVYMLLAASALANVVGIFLEAR